MIGYMFKSIHMIKYQPHYFYNRFLYKDFMGWYQEDMKNIGLFQEYALVRNRFLRAKGAAVAQC